MDDTTSRPKPLHSWVTPEERPDWIIAVGASGPDGFDQLVELLTCLPNDSPACLLAVMHRPMDRPGRLADALGRASGARVVQPEPGEVLRRGVCYVGPPDRHLCLGCGWTAALDPNHSRRERTVDLLFESAARWAGPRAVGVVLAGKTSDGARGLAAIKQAGGKAMAIDSYWAQVAGMPRAAARAVPDLDKRGPVRAIADALAALPHAPRPNLTPVKAAMPATS